MDREEEAQDLPANQETAQVSQIPQRRQTISAEFFSGPVPHPSIIEHYERILPGAADRILKMSEKQSVHRHKIESRVVWFDGIKSIITPIFAFLSIIALIGIGGYLVYKDKTLVGSLMTGLGVLIPVLAPIFKTDKQGKESSETTAQATTQKNKAKKKKR